MPNNMSAQHPRTLSPTSSSATTNERNLRMKETCYTGEQYSLRVRRKNYWPAISQELGYKFSNKRSIYICHGCKVMEHIIWLIINIIITNISAVMPQHTHRSTSFNSLSVSVSVQSCHNTRREAHLINWAAMCQTVVAEDSRSNIK